MMIKSRDYMQEKGIKSYQTLYNLQEKGKIKLIKKDRINYVLEIDEVEEKVNFENEEFKVVTDELKVKIKLLEEKLEIKEKEDVKKEYLIKTKDYEIEGLKKQIKNLERENKEKQDLLFGMQQQNTIMQQQITDLNKSNLLMLEQKDKKGFFSRLLER